LVANVKEKTMAKMKRKLFVMGLVCLLVMAILQAGCASVPPTAFEIAQSLEGTAWVQGTGATGIQLLIMNDKESGVFTDSDDKEIAFTYTAVYDSQKQTFSGTITLEDGRVVEFSAKNAGIFGWSLSAKVLNMSGYMSDFNYATPERLEETYQHKRNRAEIIKRYGSEYLDLESKVLKKEGVDFYITYSSAHGLHQTIPNAVIQNVRTGYKLHSKDGVTMTLLNWNTTTWQYTSVEGVGTFNIRVSGNTVTISNGTGTGTAFNGTYKVQ
jgi:hypothetical protein